MATGIPMVLKGESVSNPGTTSCRQQILRSVPTFSSYLAGDLPSPCHFGKSFSIQPHSVTPIRLVDSADRGRWASGMGGGCIGSALVICTLKSYLLLDVIEKNVNVHDSAEDWTRHLLSRWCRVSPIDWRRIDSPAG